MISLLPAIARTLSQKKKKKKKNLSLKINIKIKIKIKKIQSFQFEREIMEKAINRQQVLLEHLRPSNSSSHNYESILSVSRFHFHFDLMQNYFSF